MKKWIATYSRIGADWQKTAEVEGKNYCDAYVSFTTTHPKEDIIVELKEKEGEEDARFHTGLQRTVRGVRDGARSRRKKKVKISISNG